MDDLRDIVRIRGAVNRRALRRDRVFRDRSNPYDCYTDVEFKTRYRFTKASTLLLTNLIRTQIVHPTHRNHSLSPEMQVLMCLRYCATSSFQLVCGDLFAVSKATACIVINTILRSIAKLRPRFVKFPEGLELDNVQHGFQTIAQMVGIVGCIDCTHVVVVSPGGENAGVFINRKNRYSVNVQLICDHNMRITDVVARWPGSCHDARIFDNSSIKEKLATGVIPRGILLGDNGYPNRTYLLTPILVATTPGEHRYNRSHVRTRSIIERVNGVLKKRFPFLMYTSRLRLDHTLTAIVAAVVLYNFGIEQNDQWLINIDGLEQDENILPYVGNDISGLAFRRAYVAYHFA